MKKIIKATYIFLLLFSSQALSQPGWPEARQSSSASTIANPITSKISFEQRLGSEIPQNINFTDETGKRIHLSDYFGKRPVILTLVYYGCPMLCTQELNGLATAIKLLPFTMGKDFEIITLSINPKETPELAAKKKANYIAGLKNIDPNGWHFLTGKQGEIDSLTHVTGFHAVYDSISGQYAHATGIIILTPEGKISRYLFGVEYAPRDLEFAMIEASHNQIGSLASQLLLLCYRYDPASGKYGGLVIRLMQIGGVLAIIVVASLMIFLKPKWKKTAV